MTEKEFQRLVRETQQSSEPFYLKLLRLKRDTKKKS